MCRILSRQTLLAFLAGVASTLAGCHSVPQDLHQESVVSQFGVKRTERYYIAWSGKRVLHGLQEAWHKNGVLKTREERKNGQLDGPMEEWHDNGERAISGAWREGKQVGEWQWLNHRGELESRCRYDDEGQVIGSMQFWSNNHLAREDVYANGDRVEAIIYYEGGQKSLSIQIAHGQPHGKYTYWNRDGTVKAEGEWVQGKPWSGVCGGQIPGDGLYGGYLEFGRYANGKLIEKIQLSPE